MAHFKNIALIGKYQSPETREAISRLAGFLGENGVKVVLDKATANLIGQQTFDTQSLEQIGKTADLAIVVGGDGTMLNVARSLAPYDVPLVGVNRGRLGFLTDLSMDNMNESVESILNGRYSTESRMLLDAEVYSDGKAVMKVMVFNDVVISKGAEGTLIEIKVQINGSFVYNLRADGLILASPTGSTAYALSSGGPIVHPSLDCISLVPVSPHTLSNRPILVGQDAILEVTIRDASNAKAYFDSHSHFELKELDRIVVKRAAKDIRLLHPLDYDYYHMLREKLHWSGTL